MRQLLIYVPEGRAPEVLRLAKHYEAPFVVSMQGTAEDTPRDVVHLSLSNRAVGAFLDDLTGLPDAHIAYLPSGTFALVPPTDEAARQVKDVEMRSPIEVFLGGHQSVGSWGGMLGYAATAAVVAWIGLFSGTVYLLTAAMLIAPFAGPAMNSALATASGDVHLLRQGVLRYGAALLVSIAVAALLSLIFGPERPTNEMIVRGQVTTVAVLLPLTAGVAGALHLFQSERDSLVSAAAVGVLVAASLAPPAALVGMAVAIGRWELAGTASFVLVLQLVGIHLAGAVTFRLLGLDEERARFGTGRKRLFPVGVGVAAVLLAGLLWLQLNERVPLQRGSLAQRVSITLEQHLDDDPALRPVHVEATFIGAGWAKPYPVYATVVVQPQGAASAQPDRLRQDLVRLVQQQWPTVDPVIDLTVLPPQTPR